MKKFLSAILGSGFLLLSGGVAQASPFGSEDIMAGVGRGVLLAAVYSVVGTVVLFLGFKAFDKAITRIDLEKEIEKGNVAAGIFSAAVIIGIALIIAAAITG